MELLFLQRMQAPFFTKKEFYGQRKFSYNEYTTVYDCWVGAVQW